jgi:hypothetical protein
MWKRLLFPTRNYPTPSTPKLAGQADATIVLRSDKSVPVQYVVNVIDAVNDINNATQQNHKVILATSPKK